MVINSLPTYYLYSVKNVGKEYLVTVFREVEGRVDYYGKELLNSTQSVKDYIADFESRSEVSELDWWLE